MNISINNNLYIHNNTCVLKSIEPVIVENSLDVISETILTLNNFPNPFNPTATIIYSFTENVKAVELNIFNIRGQKINNFKIKSDRKNGEIIWNGKDVYGKSVPSGVYFCQLKTDNKNSCFHKMILLK